MDKMIVRNSDKAEARTNGNYITRPGRAGGRVTPRPSGEHLGWEQKPKNTYSAQKRNWKPKVPKDDSDPLSRGALPKGGKKNALVASALIDANHELNGVVDAKLDAVMNRIEQLEEAGEEKMTLKEERFIKELEAAKPVPTPTTVPVEDSQLFEGHVIMTDDLYIDWLETKMDAVVNIPNEWLPFAQEVLMAFQTDGYNDKTFKAVLGRTNMVVSRLKLKKDYPDTWANEALRVIYDVYYEYEDFSSFWKRVRMRFEIWKRTVIDGLAELGMWRLAILAVVSLPLLPFAGIAYGLYKFVEYMLNRKQYSVQRKEFFEDYCTQASFDPIKVEENVPDECGNVTLTTVALAEYVGSSFCKCKPSQYRVGFTVAINSIWIPRNCPCNEGAALRKRQLLAPLGDPLIRRQRWNEGLAALNEALPVVAAKAATVEEKRECFFSRIPVKRRNQIMAADEEARNNGLPMATTKGFPKVEILMGKNEDKRDPRFISGKTDEYLAGTGPEYYWWQKSMCEAYWNDVPMALKQNCIYVGGMTGDQVGALAYYYESLGWYAGMDDCSRFDGHTEWEALRAQLCRVGGYITPDVAMLMRSQLQVKGRTAGGWKFMHRGKTGSGGINTSYGNSEMNFMMWAALMKFLNIPLSDWAKIVLGDDGVPFCAQSISRGDTRDFADQCAEDFDHIRKYYEEFGHKLEYAQVQPHEYDRLEFCSGRFWNVGGTRVLGPKPGRVLAKSFMPHVKLAPSGVLNHMVGVAKGYKHYMWVPGVGEVCQNIIRTHKNVKGQIYGNENPYKLKLRSDVEVNQCAVDNMFTTVYDLSADLFRAHCRSFESITPGMCVQSSLLDQVLQVDGVFDDGAGSELNVMY
jgi:hypothetical protein